MINEFGYCQHLEIREGVEWFRQALRRKAGNFIIQGFAANLLRLIYIRMLKAFWAKGWIQDRRIRVHLTVHDEIDMSYHKSLNPVEVMSILYEALTVKMKGFPTFFVGINFGNSWGEAKKDEAELPVLLVKEMNEEFKSGKYRDDKFDDHLKFFQTKREDYYNRRMYKELKEINDNRNVWDIEHLSEVFTNYTVRSLLPEVGGQPLIDIEKDCEDSILLLTAYLPKFVASYILDRDSRKHHLTYKGKALQITKDLLIHRFSTIEDLFNNIAMRDETEDAVSVNDVVDMDELDLELDDVFDEMGFDFDEEVVDADEYEEDGIVNFNSGFLNRYTEFKNAKDEFKEYGSVEARVQAEIEASKAKVQQFDNFKVSNGKIILTITSPKQFVEIRKLCVGNTSSAINTLHLFIKHNGTLTDMNKYDVEFLRKLDEFLSNSVGKVGAQT